MVDVPKKPNQTKPNQKKKKKRRFLFIVRLIHNWTMNKQHNGNKDNIHNRINNIIDIISQIDFSQVFV